MRRKGLAKLGMVVLTCAQKVLERVLTAAWGRRDDVGVSAGSWRGWGVARLSGACSGAEAAEVGVRVHAHGVRGLGAGDCKHLATNRGKMEADRDHPMNWVTNCCRILPTTLGQVLHGTAVLQFCYSTKETHDTPRR